MPQTNKPAPADDATVTRPEPLPDAELQDKELDDVSGGAGGAAGALSDLLGWHRMAE